MSLLNAIDGYLSLRPANIRLSYIDDDDYPDIFQGYESQASIAVTRIRSIVGETFRTIIDDTHCVFVDQMNTEYALHYFDGTFAVNVPFKDKRIIGQALDEKRLSRSLYSIGRTCDAYIAAFAHAPGNVVFDSAETALTAHVDPSQRERFARDFERFALSHELAHVDFRITPGANHDLREWLREVMGRVDPVELAARRKWRTLNMIEIDQIAKDTVAAIAQAGELDATYAPEGLVKQLGTEEFREELLCDLVAAKIGLAEAASSGRSLQEYAQHFVLASRLTFLFRHQQFEQAFLEYVLDAMRDLTFENLNSDDVASISQRAGLYVDLNSEHYEMVQRGFLRTAFLKEYLVERIIAAEGAASETALRAELDRVELRMLEFLSAIVGPVSNWGYLLVCAIAAGRRSFLDELRERGYSNEQIETQTREEYLALNGVGP